MVAPHQHGAAGVRVDPGYPAADPPVSATLPPAFQSPTRKDSPVRPGARVGSAVWATPARRAKAARARTVVNLFQTLRGGYGSSVIGAALKTLVVWFATAFSFSVLLTGLLIFALTQI